MKGISPPIVLASLLFCTSIQAAVIDDYSAVENDRYANSSNFIGASHDLSGIGMTPGGRWATLIGPNTVISANHLRPSGMVMFYPGNDSSADPVVLRITEGQRIGDTDLWVGCLDQIVPSSITPFRFATESLTTASFADSLLRDAEVYMTGRSPSVYPAVLDQAIGKNAVTAYTEDSSAGLGSNVDTLRMVYDAAVSTGATANEEYLPFETYFEPGDSGGPLFAEIEGELILLGVNSFVTTDVQGTVTGSHASYVGNESDEANEFIDFCLSSVPEPASGGMLILGLLLLLGQRRSH